MVSTHSSFRSSLAWLKAQFGVQQPRAEGERRTNPRKRMRFDAEIQKLDSTTPAAGVDIHEDGARILSPEGWEVGTVIFLKLPGVQLGGFAQVRHCELRPDGRYSIGLSFQGPLIPQGSQWQIQRIFQPAPTDAWTKHDDISSSYGQAPASPGKSRVVA